MAYRITKLLNHQHRRALVIAACQARRGPSASALAKINFFDKALCIVLHTSIRLESKRGKKDKIPEKPITFAEGASYSLVILSGLGITAVAGYAVFKELIFEPKEYKIFGKALARIQSDSQVTAKIGHPITGYGHETRNRAAWQCIPNKIWTDEDGVEDIEVNFLIRGPHGAGKVYSEMFKDSSDRTWKFTYLIVDIGSPHPARLMLESYVPSYKPA